MKKLLKLLNFIKKRINIHTLTEFDTRAWKPKYIIILNYYLNSSDDLTTVNAMDLSSTPAWG